MSNNLPTRVRDSAVRDAGDADARLDPRVARTTHALGRALIDLMQDRDFDGITVQDILDRAGVGRATFYAHYRNKHDVLHSSYERVFTWLEPLVERPSAVGVRLFPVAEFLEHVGEAQGTVDALRRDGLLDDVWALSAGYAARMIERRLARPGVEGSAPGCPAGGPLGAAAGVPRALVARMLAGALLELVRWWQDHPSSATPAAIDAAFHQIARGALRGWRG